MRTNEQQILFNQILIMRVVRRSLVKKTELDEEVGKALRASRAILGIPNPKPKPAEKAKPARKGIFK